MDISQLDFAQATAEDICGLIDNTLSGINEKIAYATKVLKAYTKHKSSIKTLTYILAQANNPSHRHMSTVLLRRDLVNRYLTLQPQQQEEFRKILLTQYINEKVLPIQRGVAHLIGQLLPVVKLQNWNDLQQLLNQALQSDPHNISTFVLLNCLLHHFKAPKQLFGYLFNALKIPNLLQEAMKCVMAVAETQDIDQNFIIQLIGLWEQSNWPEEISLNCLEVLTTMAMRHMKMNDDIILWVCNKIVGNRGLSVKFRVSGLDFLSTYTEFCGKNLASRDKVLRSVVETVCNVCSEPFNQNKEEEGDDGLIQPIQEIALWLIETMSVDLKTKKIYPVLLDTATSLINSEDISKTNTGFLLLGGMAEGCHEKLKKNLQNPIMNILIPKGLNHPAPQVRGAAISALSYFSEYLVPDIVDYHSQIIPSMITYFSDLSTKVAEKSLIAVDVFFENMEEDDIKQYLPTVIPRLSEVLISDKSTPCMRNAALSGIGSAMEVSNTSFEPFVQNLYRICLQILKIPPSAQLNAVRGQNLTVLGKLSNIFCKKGYPNRQQFYKGYIIPIMQIVYNMLSTENDPQVKESAFMFFYLIANAIESQFDNIFDKILPHVLQSAELKVPQQRQKKQLSLDSDSQDDEQALATTKAAEYDEKAAAIRALGELANACPLKFIPYFDKAYQILDEHHQFFYDSVRIQVSNCYVNLVKGYIKSQNNGELPSYTCGLPVIQRYPEQIEVSFKNMLVPRMILMTQDQNRRPASVAIDALSKLVKDIGPVLVDQSLQTITQAIIHLFESQVAEEDEDDQGNQSEDEDTDAYILQPLCSDLIPNLCEVLLNGFLPSLNQIYPYLCKFLQERQDINENVLMTGCLSQCLKFIPSLYSQHSQQLFQNLASLSQLRDADLNRNIAYCFSQIIQKCQYEIQQYLPNILIILKNMFDDKNSHQACKDNVLAAICNSIIFFNPPMPYQQFVHGLVSSMPFKGDQQEEAVALRCIMHLTNQNVGLIQPHFQNLILIIENDLKNPEKYSLKGELFTNVSNYLTVLKNQ